MALQLTGAIVNVELRFIELVPGGSTGCPHPNAGLAKSNVESFLDFKLKFVFTAPSLRDPPVKRKDVHET